MWLEAKFICELPLRSYQLGFQISKFETSPAALRPSPYRLPFWIHIIWFSSTVVQPHTRPSRTVADLLPTSDVVCSPLLSCANKDIVVVVNAAAAVALVVALVDKVVVLVARRGE